MTARPRRFHRVIGSDPRRTEPWPRPWPTSKPSAYSTASPVPATKRPAKEPYLLALRDHFWAKEHPGQPLPEQIEPMHLGAWNDLDDEEAAAIERNDSKYCVQEKSDGVRALLHITPDGVRITGRTVSEITFRQSEFQANLPQLMTGFEHLVGTILDGELVNPKAVIETGDTTTSHPLQAAVAILATSPENTKAIQEGQWTPLSRPETGDS